MMKADSDPSGWQAQLDLVFSRHGHKTVLSHRQQYGPLTVQRAFYPEEDVCHLYILHPPSGIVGGDMLTINSTIKTQAHSLLTTPGATKFYRSQGKTAYQQHNLFVAKQASLEWLPQENIYFPGAIAHVNTQVGLAKEARFIGWETHCFGLPTNGDVFSTGQLTLDFSLTRAKRPIIIERMQVNADRIMSPTGLRGHAVMSMLVATPTDNDDLESVRESLKDDDELIAATLIEDCLIIRYLGNSTEKSRQLLFKAWSILRSSVLNRDVCAPRIWAT